jgi:protein involved in polysaccharide export with SLBB domain
MYVVVLVRMLLVLAVTGCGGGPTVQMQQAQILGQTEGSTRNESLQKQIMSQASRAALTDYKDYTVGPEDMLAVQFFGVDSLNREARVNGQGEITLPLVGVVQVSGMTSQ